MKRTTARWSSALAAATLLCLPASGFAQTPPPAQPPSAAAAEPASTPDEHLGKARAALDSIEASALPARAKNQVAELKRHLTALEKKSAAPSTAAPASKSASASWATDVAAMDKIIATLVDNDSAPVGTSGGATSKPAATIDDATKGKLMEVRQALTAYAASKSGAAPPTPSEPAPAPTAAPPATTPPPEQPPATPPSTPPQQPPAAAPPAAAQPPAVDQDAARKALVEARETLSQLTQLPAAAQLAGDTRTQVSQLINNFNELISSQSDWRGAFAKVQGNMLALLGPESSVDEPSRPTPSSTSGAVGTSGSAAAMDPAIKAKLVELRAKLNAFEKAAGGAAAPAATPATDPAAATPPSQPATPPSAPPATPPSAQPSTPPPSASPEPQKPAPAQAAMGHDEAMRHIQAIEAILSGNTPTATSGTNPPAAATAAPLTLTAAQVAELKTHLAELKKLVGQAKK